MARRRFWRLLQDEGVEERIKEGGLYVVVIGGALALLFTWLTLQGLPYADVIANAKREYIQRVALVVYYLSWVGGTRFDLETQKSVYLLDPNRGRSRAPALAVVASIFVAFAVLLFVRDDDRKLVIALAAFISVNVLSWRFFVRNIVGPIIAASRATYLKAGDFIGIERLKLMERYIAGDWQWRRFAVMSAMVLLASVVIGLDGLRAGVAQVVNRLYQAVPAEKIDPLLAPCVLALLILIAEIWIWIMRLRTRHALRLLDDLSRHYQLAPQPQPEPQSAPPPAQLSAAPAS
ncbi:MAG: hypothetical protein ACRED5_11685 [Propylenella sp.]